MRIGIQIPSFTWPGGARAIRGKLAEIARAAEEAGFYSVWVMDHFFQIPIVGPAEQEMLEGYSALSYLAGITERVKLGTLVTGVTYRHPGVLAKTVTTLDVLSGGRAYLGIGAAWFDREHARPRRPVPAAQGALRTPRGGAPDREADLVGRRRAPTRASTTSSPRR